MRMVIGALILAATLGLSTQRPGRDVAPPRATYLADLTWVEAEQVLRPETVDDGAVSLDEIFVAYAASASQGQSVSS